MSRLEYKSAMATESERFMQLIASEINKGTSIFRCKTTCALDQENDIIHLLYLNISDAIMERSAEDRVWGSISLEGNGLRIAVFDGPINKIGTWSNQLRFTQQVNMQVDSLSCIFNIASPEFSLEDVIDLLNDVYEGLLAEDQREMTAKEIQRSLEREDD